LPESVLEVLRASRVEIVDVVGRRGPGQVAFTTKEFREMLALPNVHFAGVDKALLEEAEAEVERIGGPEARMRKRLLGLMAKGNSKSGASPASLANPQKTFRLSFLRSPISFNSNPVEPSTPILRPRVSSITYGLNALLAPPVPTVSWTPPHQPAEQPAMTLAIPTGEKVEVRTDMVIESVGYRSEPIGEAGLIPFDNRKGRVRNVGGRVVDEEGLPVSRRPLLSIPTKAHLTCFLILSSFPTSTHRAGSRAARSASSLRRCMTRTQRWTSSSPITSRHPHTVARRGL
jgi:adrenodoxin-NADP+ reductase